jgi:hypothetical protein
MTESNSKKLSDQIADSVKSLQLDEVDWRRPPSQSDFDYLLDHCPFLQIIDTSNEPNIEPEVKIIKSESNWNIHYYGDAMSSSPGLLLFGGGDFRIKFFGKSEEEEEGGEGGGGDLGVINPDKGTFRNQAFMTAKEMVEIAKKMGWKGIRIIAGHPLMEWSAWVAAKDLDLPLSGYEFTEWDEQKRKRVKRSRVELETIVGYRPKGGGR